MHRASITVATGEESALAAAAGSGRRAVRLCVPPHRRVMARFDLPGALEGQGGVLDAEEVCGASGALDVHARASLPH